MTNSKRTMKSIISFTCLLLLSLFAHAQTEIYYIHNDHLGTPQVLTDQNQNVVWKADQTPFGELQNETGTVQQPIRFPGQYADPETGYYYNYYRDYDPSLGRYLQSDPIGLRGGMNTYGYVGGNPLNYTDPTGENALVVGGVTAMATALALTTTPQGQEVLRNFAQAVVNAISQAASNGNTTDTGLPNVASNDETKPEAVSNNEYNPGGNCYKWRAEIESRKEGAELLCGITSSSSQISNLISNMNYDIAAYNASCKNISGPVSPMFPSF